MMPQSPLALPFEQALQPSLFLKQLQTSSERRLIAELAAQGGKYAGITAATAKIVLEQGTITVVFEKAARGTKLMESAGGPVANVVGTNGRIIEVGKVASKGRKAASMAATAALLVVETAHLISGYDNAKRLKRIERSVDQLVFAHESELKSRLEAIYRYSKELLHPAQPLTDEDKRELHRQSRDLFELRARWRDDFRHYLAKIERIEESFFTKWMFWRRNDAIKEQKRKTKAQESEAALEIVQLMHFSLMLQMTLAGSSERMAAFRELSLPDECRQWRDLAKFGRKRVKEIAGSDEDKKEFANFLGHLDGLADYWDILQKPESSTPQKTAKKLTAKRTTTATTRTRKTKQKVAP